jgi:hypothetical protein
MAALLYSWAFMSSFTSAAPTELSTPAFAKPASRRLISLDVFRGLALAGMILLDNPGNDDLAYGPIKHRLEWLDARGFHLPLVHVSSGPIHGAVFPGSTATRRDTRSDLAPRRAANTDPDCPRDLYQRLLGVLTGHWLCSGREKATIVFRMVLFGGSALLLGSFGAFRSRSTSNCGRVRLCCSVAD